MPCSYCRSSDHNISTCNSAASRRAIGIYNESNDPFPRRLNPTEWFKSNSGANSGFKPNEALWSRPINLGRNTANAESNVMGLLTQFHNLRYNSQNTPGYYMRNEPGRPLMKYVIDENNKIQETLIEDLSAWNNYIREWQNINARRNRENALRINERRQLQRQQQVQRQQQRLQQQQVCFEQKKANLILVDKPIDSNECLICMDTLGATNKTILRCGHQYCGDCIFTHFQSAGGTCCPACRQDYAVRVPNWVPPNSGSNVHQSNRDDTSDLFRMLMAIHNRN